MARGALLAAVALSLVIRRRRAEAAGAATVATLESRAYVPTEIAPGVHLLGPCGRSQTNAYLVRAGSSWVLVDAGWAGDELRLRSAAQSLLGPGQVPGAILLTHAHPDHAGSARELARAWGCPVYAHPAELPLATGDFAAMARYAGPLDRWLILPVMRAIGRRRREAVLASSSLGGVVRTLDAGGAVAGLDGWAWVHTPGHTPGSVAYVRASDAVVLSGDAVLTLQVNAWAGLLLGRQGLSGPPWYTTWDRGAALASIGHVAGLEPRVLAPGHGLPLTGPATAAEVHAFAVQAGDVPRRRRVRPWVRCRLPRASAAPSRRAERGTPRQG